MEIIPLIIQTIIASVSAVLFYQNYMENKRVQQIKKEALEYIESIKLAHNTQATTLENLIRKVDDLEMALVIFKKGNR